MALRRAEVSEVSPKLHAVTIGFLSDSCRKEGGREGEGEGDTMVSDRYVMRGRERR